MLVPLALPPGVHRNGTAHQSKGRWRDASLVRWREGAMGPVGGWQARADVASAPPRGAVSWQTLAGDRMYAVGTYNGCYAMTSGNTITDITPAGLTAGTADAAVNIGYGTGAYGEGTYGAPRTAYGEYAEATVWHLDTWGQELIACSSADGRLWAWDLNAANDLVVVPGAPTGNRGVVVTDERFLVALGAGGNPRNVAWSDREARTTWTPAATNQAGDLDLQTAGQAMQALKVPGRTLILTDEDAHAMTYIGPPFVHRIDRVGTSCGAVSRQAGAVLQGAAYWMGTRGFFRLAPGGTVEEIPCDVADHVFGTLNVAQQSKVWAVANGQFGEVWWHFPQGTECDAYVAYSARENHWSIGVLSRTAGFDRGVFRAPVWFASDGMGYDHETGFAMDDAAVFAESAPFEMGEGDALVTVLRLLPDEGTQGDASVTFKTRMYPNAAESTHGPYAMANPTSVRFTGREARLRVTQERLGAWRWGVPRVEVRERGLR